MAASAADKKNVQETWAAISKDWEDKNGFEFYTQMFANVPAIKAAFANANLKAQSKAFGVMVTSWVNGLNDKAVFDTAMGSFVTFHAAKGITDKKLFKAALDELTKFIKKKSGLTVAQGASWEVVKGVILEAMNF